MMRRLAIVVVGLSFAAFTLARQDISPFEQEGVSATKRVSYRSNEADQQIDGGNNRLFRNNGHRHVDYQRRPSTQERDRHDDKHNRGHNARKVLVAFIRLIAAEVGMEREDAYKILQIFKIQMLANRIDLFQDRSNWTEAEFRAQFKRVYARHHGDAETLAKTLIKDEEQVTEFFKAALTLEKEIQRHVFAILKSHLRKMSRAANMSDDNLDRFLVVLEKNPIQIIYRRNMSVAERWAVLKALNAQWTVIKEEFLRTLNNDDEERRKAEVFLAAIEKDFNETIRNHEHFHKSYLHLIHYHKQYFMQRLQHDNERRHHSSTTGDKEHADYPHGHRSHDGRRRRVFEWINPTEGDRHHHRFGRRLRLANVDGNNDADLTNIRQSIHNPHHRMRHIFKLLQLSQVDEEQFVGEPNDDIGDRRAGRLNRLKRLTVEVSIKTFHLDFQPQSSSPYPPSKTPQSIRS